MARIDYGRTSTAMVHGFRAAWLINPVLKPWNVSVSKEAAYLTSSAVCPILNVVMVGAVLLESAVFLKRDSIAERLQASARWYYIETSGRQVAQHSFVETMRQIAGSS